MENIIKEINIKTNNAIDIIDITDYVKTIVAESGVESGVVNIITRHTTAAVNINEREEKLQKDMLIFLESFVPKDGDYLHNRDTVDGRNNAHSHLMALFTNASETIPIYKSKLIVGEWQSIFFIELDGPREERKITVQIYGE